MNEFGFMWFADNWCSSIHCRRIVFRFDENESFFSVENSIMNWNGLHGALDTVESLWVTDICIPICRIVWIFSFSLITQSNGPRAYKAKQTHTKNNKHHFQRFLQLYNATTRLFEHPTRIYVSLYHWFLFFFFHQINSICILFSISKWKSCLFLWPTNFCFFNCVLMDVLLFWFINWNVQFSFCYCTRPHYNPLNEMSRSMSFNGSSTIILGN